MNLSRGRSSRQNRGSAIVETALIGLVFFAMMLGIFDFGQYLFIQHAIVERARLAARWGAINNPTDSTSIKNMVLYNQSTAPAAGTPTYFGITAGNITVATSGKDASGNLTDDYVMTMTISGYTLQSYSLWIAGSYTGAPITVTVPLGKFS